MATALAVPPPKTAQIPDSAWQQAGWLPCRLQAEIAVRGFTVGDLLSIEVGALLEAGVAVDADVSLRVNGARIGCAQLDLLGERLAVRVTELL
jgi:flagellar motor switch/type III secretory pathway protein FliN